MTSTALYLTAGNVWWKGLFCLQKGILVIGKGATDGWEPWAHFFWNLSLFFSSSISLNQTQQGRRERESKKEDHRRRLRRRERERDMELLIKRGDPDGTQEETHLRVRPVSAKPTEAIGFSALEGKWPVKGPFRLTLWSLYVLRHKKSSFLRSILTCIFTYLFNPLNSKIFNLRSPLWPGNNLPCGVSSMQVLAGQTNDTFSILFSFSWF